METKRQYTTPTLKVVAFKVEDGFQSIDYSMRLSTSTPPDAGSPFNGQNQENWNNDQGGVFDNVWPW